MTLTCDLPRAQVRDRPRLAIQLLAVFVVCLAIPVVIQAGPLRLSPYRIVLLVALAPCLWAWFVGGIGKTRLADVLVVLIASWSALSFLRVHGLQNGIESAGIVFVETLVPYLIARISIRNADDFRFMVRLLLCLVFFLLPFAVIETLTAWNGLNRLADIAFQTYPDVSKPARWGMDRVQGPFEHPILFGVFAGSALALCYYALPRARMLAALSVAMTAMLSLSSGPLTALLVQAGMIGWDRIMSKLSNRWVILAILAAIAYAVVDLLSNRSPAEVFISHAAFNPQTAYNRLLIWEWGWVNIWQNPWFGLGNSDWQRLWFMTASVDMFWIQKTMVHGLPVGLLYQSLFFAVVFGLIRVRVRVRGPDAVVAQIRTGLVICLIGFYIAGMTVHFWNATYVWLMFLFGAAGWIPSGHVRAVDEREAESHRMRECTPKGLLAR